jgi:rhamnopyranosyl-N-acetylglucosaminyl-diphospho-decaprenol beta-1,3/1,4-galactofuranosyltransferase
VVTFNRPDLLIRCLRAVLRQDMKPDRVLVLDNASTQETFSVLRDGGLLDNPAVRYFRLERNRGSGGGFAEGTRIAHSEGHEYLWLMDDDGFPAASCLAQLMKHAPAWPVLGPAVVLPEDPNRLSWKVRNLYASGQFVSRRYTEWRSDLSAQATGGVLAALPNLWNGILLSRGVVDRVGLPIEELFIWGDELEYALRCREAGFPMAICPAALFFHPHRMPGVDPRRFYYLNRNLLFIFRKYGRQMYRWPGNWLYPIYLAGQMLWMTPDRSPRYLVRLAYACVISLRGRLVPWSSD